MATSTEYEDEIKGMGQTQLQELWAKHAEGTFDKDFWKSGKLLEYVVLRAFELEGAKVTYPYSVRDDIRNIEIEQIDGAIHIDGFHCLTECKDYAKDSIDVVPLAKMRNQLARRHSSLFGMFFTMTKFTDSAEALVGYMAPQLILLWEREDFDYCIMNGCFVDCMKKKYEAALESCEYDFKYAQSRMKEDAMRSNPLF